MPLKICFAAFYACAALTGPAAGELTPREASMRTYVACEGLRSADPEIKNAAIQQLFELGGLTAYRILHLEWIAEPNPEIRREILVGFRRIGDHRHTASEFPQDWIKAAKRFSSEERAARIAELQEHFPEETRAANKALHGTAGSRADAAPSVP